jgi:nidogen-like
MSLGRQGWQGRLEAEGAEAISPYPDAAINPGASLTSGGTERTLDPRTRWSRIMKHNNGGRRSLRALITAIALSFAWVGGAAAAAIEPFGLLPGALSRDDDTSSAAVDIGFPINFFGVTHNQLFVNNNGNVTLGAPFGGLREDGLAGTRQAIIAPFFADVDTRAAGSGIVGFGTPPGRPDLFVVDWIAVGYANQHDDRLNSFQLILENLSAVPGFVPGDFRITFNYDQILWETGDFNGGINGLGVKSARVGFSNGSGQPGTFFELPGSGSTGSFPDGGRHSLVGNKTPIGDATIPLGRYQFVVRNGAIAQADLAIAAAFDVDGDKPGFEFVAHNFGLFDARGVKVTFDLERGRIITSVRPRGLCRRVVGDRTKASCMFPVIQRSRRIRIKTTSRRGGGAITSATFDSDLSNNFVRASKSCGGQILSQTPESVLYEATATVPGAQTLQLKITNSGHKRIQIRRLTPVVGQPFLIDRVTPRLPRTIKPDGAQVFQVQTVVPVVSVPRLYTVQRPYFEIGFRCLD